MINKDAYRGAFVSAAVVVDAGVSHVASDWRSHAAAAAAMSAARLATAGHVAEIPQRKRTAENFVFVNRGNT